MTKPGPKPRPRVLTILAGNPGKRPLPDEPDPGGKLSCPSHLKGDARNYWRRIVPKLVECGVAKSSDREALETLCQLWGCLRKAAKAAEDDPLDKDNRLNMIAYSAEWGRMAARFGLTPSDRTRIVAGPVQKKEADPAARYIG